MRGRLNRVVGGVKAQSVADAWAHLDDWAEALAATADYRAVADADMRRRAGGAFTAYRLGFASTDVGTA